MRTSRWTRRPLLALVALAVILVVGYAIRAHDAGPGTSRPSVPLSQVPAQVATTVALIKAGGPFPYPDDDGVVFHNYEHELPREPDGYYREYTVPTPGSTDRGARRVVAGGHEFFYTGDHYQTFLRLRVPT